MIKNWRSFVSKVPEKPDLLDVILRRRRTVENYLENLGVSDEKTLTETLKSLSQEYSISNEFISKARNYIKTLAKKEKEPITETEEIEVNEEENIEETQQAPKKRGRKPSVDKSSSTTVEVEEIVKNEENKSSQEQK